MSSVSYLKAKPVMSPLLRSGKQKKSPGPRSPDGAALKHCPFPLSPEVVLSSDNCSALPYMSGFY